MSWLYSIVFAGLVLSSNTDTPKQVGPMPVPRATVEKAAAGDETERFEQSYPLTANGRVRVSNVNGPITVEAWERNEVRLEAVKIANTKEALAEVEIRVDSRADSLTVEADYEGWRRTVGDKGWRKENRLEVQFRLSVPRTAALDEIETVNGSVTVSNFVNLTKISAVNGNVNATNLRGTANLSTVNGEVAADFDRLEKGTKISLSTVNGKVNLLMPSDANATLKADSLNGEIRNDFGLPVRKGKYVGRDMYGRVGNGDVQVKLESVNGPLTIQRRNDGRSPNPATNLLPQKSKDGDEDWDDDTSWKSNTEKWNKDIAKAVEESTIAVAAGSEIAKAELARVVIPDLEKIRVESLPAPPANKPNKVNKIEKVEKTVNKSTRKTNEGLRGQGEALPSIRRVRWSGTNQFIEKKSNTFAVKGTPRVTVEAKGSAVKVRGWNRNEVKYVLTQMDGRRRMPASVGESVSESAIGLKVLNNERASRDMYFSGDTDSVRIEVFVPQKANLKIISNGEIRLDGVSGEIELNGVDEEIDVRNVEGKLKLSAADGQVRIIGFNGELESKTGSADVYLEGNFSRVTSNAADGTFVVTVPENYNADVTSNVEALTVENLKVPQSVKEGQWRFGAGGPKLNFTLSDGEVKFRNMNTLTNPNSR